MKKRLIPDSVTYVYEIFYGVMLGVFLCYVIGGLLMVALSFAHINLADTDANNELFFLSLKISIGIGIILMFIASRASNYRRAISRAYTMNISSALGTNYPEGIIYILENTLKELNKFGIDNFPIKNTVSLTKRDSGISKSEMRGFPNQNNLRNAIIMAQDFCREWDEIARLGGLNARTAQIDAMERIKNLIRPEEMSLDWEKMKVKGGQEIYWFSYTEEDHRAVSGLNHNTVTSGKTPHQQPSPRHSFDNLSTPTQPRNKVLSFEEFLQQNQGLSYLSEREQKEEYYKYLTSMGVQPPSPKPDSTYQDESVWDDEDQDYKGQSPQTYENYKQNYQNDDDSVW